MLSPARRAMGPEMPNIFMMFLSFIGTFLAAWLVAAVLVFLIGMIWGLVRGFDRSHFAARTRWRGKRLLARFRDHRMSAVLGSIVIFLITVALFATRPVTFQPDKDLNTAEVSVRMPPGTTIETTEAIVSRVATIVEDHPDVIGVYQRSFADNGQVGVLLSDDRSKPSKEIEGELAAELAVIPDAQVNFITRGPGGGGGRQLTMNLGSSDPVLLRETAAAIVSDMVERPEFIAPRITGDNPRPEIIGT